MHTIHGVLALENNKNVLIEKPLTLCQRDIQELMAAEKLSTGKVFVGYMRRYASGFLDAIKEIGDPECIQYVRVRDIICPNDVFISQSATFPQKFNDVGKVAVDELLSREDDMVFQALSVDMGLGVTDERKKMLRLLGSLGSHDLSAMREIIGMPKGVIGARLKHQMWHVLFDYGHFSVIYESGFNSVPLFDASIEVFTETKVVTVIYDTPYVKGLPTKMVVREKVGEASYQERTRRTSFEDPYTKEMLAWYNCIVNNATPKTTIEDASNDLEIFKMILKASG
ncbi:hypothetical protein H072_9284 [Dactylellina haptotyla CBS 200.50]|uniref:Gfo/Idh/MocA-like oxidoreductase N-terminal domain-containing protein n=1 Tax=Dactylellina haptotyla (strain CBS 200.50) TaxID=1284197 RepID=S8A7J0_DACHA|nr:hypothetical protein H072_9284 [Dactylellina haptotyla CBS 200.50]